MAPNPNFWAGRPVCVTGGTGFLGYHLVRQLLDLRARVRVLALPPAPDHPLLREARVEIVPGDVRDADVVRRAVADRDVIFHTAGLVAVWGPALQRMHEVHIQGTRQVLSAAAPAALVVHTSSVVAVGATRDGLPLTEDARFNLDGLCVDYVHAKRAAEEEALAAADRGQHVVVVNPGYLIGPEDHEASVMGRLCERFWKGRVLFAPPGGVNLVDVRDVARGHLLAAEHGQPGRRYILGGENHTCAQFLHLLAQTCGLRPRALPRLPNWALTLFALVAHGRAWLKGKEPYPSLQQVRLNRYHWFYHSDRAVAELGYRARPLWETLADTYRWFAERGRLGLRGLNRWWMRPQAVPERAA
jgi:dihydroflavonol-4-reductase